MPFSRIADFLRFSFRDECDLIFPFSANILNNNVFFLKPQQKVTLATGMLSYNTCSFSQTLIITVVKKFLH